jgi:hypothetical protein
MAASTVDSDLVVTGNLQCTTISLPESCVVNANVSGSDPLAAAKTRHRHLRTQRQAHGTAATAERRVVHVAHAAGTVSAFRVGPVVAAVGDSTATLDLYKNGTTVLSGTVVVNNSKAAYSKTTGTVSSAAYVAGDVFEVVQTISAGTGTLPQGVFADAVFDELAG